MRIIVSDTSCLIDLRKAALVTALLGLDYEIVIPDVLFERELLSLGAAEKRDWLRRGLRVETLSGDLVSRAVGVQADHPALSVLDCFAFVLAFEMKDAVLLTGDRMLRRVAARAGIEVHGALWVLDEIAASGLTPRDVILDALRTWLTDATVFLPKAEIEARLRRLRGP